MASRLQKKEQKTYYIEKSEIEEENYYKPPQKTYYIEKCDDIDLEYKHKKYKRYNNEQNNIMSDYNMAKVKSEYQDDSKPYREHKKDKKRDKEKKKKRSKDKKRQKVRVREINENDYVMEIMDRTPTPSSMIKHEVKEEPDVKEEPVEEEMMDWAQVNMI